MMRGALAGASLLLLLTASGCDTLFKQGDDTDPASAHPGAGAGHSAGTEEGRREVAGYLSFADVLDNTDQQGWHTIFEHTLDAYDQDPIREKRMRLALVMSRSDRNSGESRVTQTMLTDARKLFDETTHDTASAPGLVRKFAQLQVNEIDRRLALYEELRSLRSQLAKAYQANQTAQRDRTEAEVRMRQIDAALAEANAKLEAVLRIERNIGPTGKETFP
jgi:hypothetical protein